MANLTYQCSRQYYERTNDLIQQYLYIDCLLDSSIPHDLLNEYSVDLEASQFRPIDVPATIAEETSNGPDSSSSPTGSLSQFNGAASYGSTNTTTTPNNGTTKAQLPAKRTPKDIFRSSENLPLLAHPDGEPTELSPRRAPIMSDLESGPKPILPWLEEAEVDSDDPIVTLAIYVNLVANVILLVGKLVVILSVPSMSVLASLVDAVLDFLSTAIVWTTTRLISTSNKDAHNYPVGRRRLEPLGVLVFSVIMVTSFCQVSLSCIQRLAGPEHEILELGLPAIVIMVSTIVIKGACWVWCRLVRNSSVRALYVSSFRRSNQICSSVFLTFIYRAEDAKTDVIFNFGSILFPISRFFVLGLLIMH